MTLLVVYALSVQGLISLFETGITQHDANILVLPMEDGDCLCESWRAHL